MKQDIGIIGLGVMGQNLALNIESKGYSVRVFDAWTDRVTVFMEGISNKNITGAFTVEEFVNSLAHPKKIFLLLKDGRPVDDAINSLLPYLTKGDIVVDGGNSHFKDTIRRNKTLAQHGIRFIGAGISGGQQGALKGLAIMASGQREAYDVVAPILTAISAKVGNEPCCAFIGNDGAGHYVKMVHNGIEYGDMQLISETYFLLKKLLKLDNYQLHRIFKEWNEGELNSYLIEITADIFLKRDEDTGQPLIDVIKDVASQKGTGSWMCKNAMELGVPVPTISEAVFARCMSWLREERLEASKILKSTEIKQDFEQDSFKQSLQKALYASKICVYAQGFSLLRAASREYGWQLDYGTIASIFRGGCIIRAAFLQKIKEAYDKNSQLSNLMLDEYFSGVLQQYEPDLRLVVSQAVLSGIAVPAMASALSYYDSYKTERLPANLVQAQRDYFGAHTYERIDKPGQFHTQW